MSRSYECYDCGDRTERYDDAYCPACREKRRKIDEAAQKKAAERHAAAIIVLENLGFPAQAEILTKTSDHKLVDRLEKELNSYKDAYRTLEQDCARWREECERHRDKANGDYWGWQNDENNHLESLVCPILISASDLRSLLAHHNEQLKSPAVPV